MNGKHISVSRLQLGVQQNTMHLTLPGKREYYLYPLIGEAIVRLSSEGSLQEAEGCRFVGWIGGRGAVTEPPRPALHIVLKETRKVLIESQTLSTDMICVGTTYEPSGAGRYPSDVIEFAKPITREVGSGVYGRQVTDMYLPGAWRMHIGETLSLGDGVRGGCWSSWPPHATEADATELYASHEEYFLLITPTRGVMWQNGVMTDGTRVDDVVGFGNNTFMQVPLGSHSVCFHPGVGPCWGWYLWVYDSYLRKTYNTAAHHVGTYVK